MFTMKSNLFWIIKVLGNAQHTIWIPRKKHIFADFSRTDMNMVLADMNAVLLGQALSEGKGD